MENAKGLLSNISRIFKDREQEFKNLVCQKCSWSEATYYRKRKNSKNLSVAVKTIIYMILHEMLQDITEKTNKIIKP